MLSVLIHTLGCKLNQLESESYIDAFIQVGFNLHDPKVKTSPSVIVINTCTVTSKADQKARRVIRKSLKNNPDSIVFVTGCYAQLDKPKIEKLESNNSGRFFVLKDNDKEGLLDLPRFLVKNKNDLRHTMKSWTSPKSVNFPGAFQFSPEKFSSRTRSLLKIQDGCDKHCTYCRIRLARGKSISLPAERALERLQFLEENHNEAVLTGVNICQYRDTDAAGNLGELLEYLLSGTKKISLRLSSLAPESVDGNLTKILSHKRIRPHFHLSIQSGSEKILKKMGRNYNAETIEKAAGLLRSAKKDPFLACDIITGFPGETEAEFKESYELCKKTDFAWIHVFPYSKRPDTPAFSFTDAVQEKEITKRVQLFTELAWQGRSNYIRRWLGSEVEVLTEKSSPKKTFCRGISENYLKILVQYNEEKAPPPGTVLHCRLPEKQEIKHKNEDYDAIALEIVESFG